YRAGGCRGSSSTSAHARPPARAVGTAARSACRDTVSVPENPSGWRRQIHTRALTASRGEAARRSAARPHTRTEFRQKRSALWLVGNTNHERWKTAWKSDPALGVISIE